MLAAGFPQASGAAVYRCTADDGVLHFSQFPCGGGETVTIKPTRTLGLAPLSDGEQRLLNELDRQQRRAEAKRSAAHERAAAEARARHEARRARCEAARAARAALDRQRRKGYSLAEARALDHKDAEVDAELREHC